MKILSAIAAAVIVTGCASVERSPSLSGVGDVKYERAPQGYDFVTGANFRFPGAVKNADILPVCISQNVQNRGVTLRGTESRTMPFTGRTLSYESKDQIAGGQVIRYLSEDKKLVVAEGSETYGLGGLLTGVERNVRYTLTVKAALDEKIFSFDKLEVAQLSSGVASNSGYGKIGSWSAAQPELALKALQKVADDLDRCINMM